MSQPGGSLKFTLPIAVVTSMLLGAVGSYWSFASESKVDRAELRVRIIGTEARLDRLEKFTLDANETLKRIEVALATIGTKLDGHVFNDRRVPGTSSALPRADGSPGAVSDKPALGNGG